MTRFTPQWIQAGSYSAGVDRRLIGALWPAARSTGHAVTFNTAMTVNVAAGQTAVPTANGTGTVLCSSDTTEVVTIGTAPGAGSNRIDRVVVRPRATDIGSTAEADFILDVIAGAVAASPVAPAVPNGTVSLAQVYVTGGSASLSAAAITDERPGNLAIPVTPPTSAPRGWIGTATGPATLINAGATATNIVQLTVQLVAGRRYRAFAYILASQQAAVGNPMSTFIDSGGYLPSGVVRPFWAVAWPTAVAISGYGSWTFVATATANDTFTVTASSSAGNCQVGVNNAQVNVEDVGA